MRTLPLTPPKGDSESESVVFENKIQVQSNKVCYKVSLCENWVKLVSDMKLSSRCYKDRWTRSVVSYGLRQIRHFRLV